MNKKKTIKTFALAIALGAAMSLPVSLHAQGNFNNSGFGESSEENDFYNQGFGLPNSSNFGIQSFGLSDLLSFGNQSFGISSGGSGSLGNQSFGVSSGGSGSLGNQTFGDFVGGSGSLGIQWFGEDAFDFSNLFNNQYFGQEPDAPTGSGLALLLLAGAGYALIKKKETKE